VRSGPGAPGWSPRESLLLGAVDALHNDRDIDDGLWAALAVELGEEELIELCLLIGHYEMLAMTLNALRVQPDAKSISNRPWLIRAGEKVLQR
jgi:alkylhydroperoxidase family enzyme